MENSTSPPKVFIERDRGGLYGLHVSNIPPDLNENDLRDLFHTSGLIKVCKIIKSSDNSRVAFVKFPSHGEAAIALKKCSGITIGDHILEVRPAYESRNYRQNKDKSSSLESLTKQDLRNQQSSSNLHNGVPASENKKAEQRDERDIANTAKERLNKSPIQAPRTYILPASSQDIRYSSNGNANSSESLNEPNLPLNLSTFNKLPAANSKDTPKHTGIAASLNGLKNTETPLQIIHAKPKMDASNKARESTVSSVTHLTKSLEKNYLDNTLKRGQHMQHQKAGLDLSQQSNQRLQKPKHNKNMEHSNSEHSHQKSQQSQLYNTNISKWSVEEVAEYYETKDECSESMVLFIKEQEIDGNALMLIEESSLLYFMKLGPALKFLNIREILKN